MSTTVRLDDLESLQVLKARVRPALLQPVHFAFDRLGTRFEIVWCSNVHTISEHTSYTAPSVVIAVINFQSSYAFITRPGKGYAAEKLRMPVVDAESICLLYEAMHAEDLGDWYKQYHGDAKVQL